MMSKKELIATNVANTLERFSTVDTVYATSDGQVFISENYARLHAKDKRLVVSVHNRRTDHIANETDVSAPVNLARLKKDELLDLIKEKGIEVDETATKKVLISLLEAEIEEVTEQNEA